MEIDFEQARSFIFSKYHSSTIDYMTFHYFHNGAHEFTLSDMYMYESNLRMNNSLRNEYMKYYHQVHLELLDIKRDRQ